MQFNVHAAKKSQLSKLIDAALAGEEVAIARGKQPVVPLVALPQSGVKLGAMAGRFGTPPDLLEPMVEDDLEGWEGR